jgi:hypothetical protein
MQTKLEVLKKAYLQDFGKEMPKHLQEMQCEQHKYFLKCDSFSKQQYHRECIMCGKKAKITKYKIEL